MKQYVVAASMMMAVFASGTTHANLITNGDFATDSSGWTYNNQGVDGGYAGTLGNPAGSFWINHNGNNVGSDPDPMISQTIATATGNPYILSFDFIARVIAGPKGFAVDINGVEAGTYDLGGTWVTETAYAVLFFMALMNSISLMSKGLLFSNSIMKSSIVMQ